MSTLIQLDNNGNVSVYGYIFGDYGMKYTALTKEGNIELAHWFEDSTSSILEIGMSEYGLTLWCKSLNDQAWMDDSENW